MRQIHDPTIEEQRHFWNWHWEHEAERRTRNPWKDRRHAKIVEYIESAVPLNCGMRILDVGCGSGWYTEGLTRFGSVTGIDLSDEGIARARARFPHIEFVAGNFYEPQLLNGPFDIVVAQEVFDHVESQPRFLERVAHLLRPQGYFVLSCTNRFTYQRRGEGVFPDQPREHIERSLTRRELRAILSHQFEVLRLESIIPFGHGGILRVVNSARLNGIAGKLVSEDRLTALKERLGLGYQNVVLTRKVSCP